MTAAALKGLLVFLGWCAGVVSALCIVAINNRPSRSDDEDQLRAVSRPAPLDADALRQKGVM